MKLVMAVFAASIAVGGLAAGLTDGPSTKVSAIELQDDEARREESGSELSSVEGEADDDRTRGDDGTNGGNNTGDGDRTRGNDATNGGNNTGDGDRTRGNDGTNGGNNTGDQDVTEGEDGTAGGDNTAAPAASYASVDSVSGGGGTT